MNLRYDKSFLDLLNTTTPLQRKVLLVTATPSQIHSICECIVNVLYGTVPIDDRIRRSLGAHRSTLYALAEPTLPYADKKKLLVQEGGGFLSDLLPVILPALSLLI